MRNFSAEITAIKLISFRTNAMLDLLAQMQSFTIYESVFEPLVKAELLVDDQIGLFVNFPLTGEEFVVITYKPTSDNENAAEHKRVFVINAITSITPQVNARGYKYAIHLISRYAFENNRVKVSHAYGSGTISAHARSLFQTYLVEPASRLRMSTPFPNHELANYPTSIDDVEDTIDYNTIVIPNLHPIDALKWLANKAVSVDYTTNYHYTFYETLNAFHFKTIQRDIQDSALRQKAYTNPYYFIADIVLAQSNEFTLNGRTIVFDKTHSIINLVQRKRFSTLDKVSGGYFENSYFEINLYENSYRHTDLKQEDDTCQKLEPFMLNTKAYADAARYENDKHNIEELNRVYYGFNNTNGTDQYAGPYHYDRKVPRLLMSQMGFDQISLNITLEGDTELQAGDLIYVLVPEMHGFNIVREDPFISGYYLISEIKHIFTVGGHHGMVLGLSKDSYGVDLNSYYNRYGSLGSTAGTNAS